MAGLSLRHRLEAAALSALGLLLRPLPLRWVSLPGAALGWLLFSVFRLERKTTLRNIELAFGAALPAAARRRLARDCYMFFGGLACEVLSQARLRPATIARHIELEGLAALDEALAAGRGVVMVSGHYGNWELLGAGLAARGYPVSYYVGQQENPVADAALNAVRRASGLGTVPKGPSIRNLLRLLRAGQVLGLLADQHYIHKTHYIRFFGQPVSAAPGAASLALRTGARVVFCWAEPIGRYRYRAHFRAVRCSPSGEEARDVLALSQAISDALEAQVRRAPAFYFWMHRRFR
ncbi:MAG: lysophospholipid acyltransferase family protein, partial [Candidatus Lambdaproteobacteria bacterium]|nr:lysophospholipid acyltransferase family protein [Candidatus Lambdaproteobacteria bacterium]